MNNYYGFTLEKASNDGIIIKAFVTEEDATANKFKTYVAKDFNEAVDVVRGLLGEGEVQS